MKFLAIEKELKIIDTNSKSVLLAEEERAVFELYKKGIIREIYFNENKCVVIILEYELLEGSKEFLNLLPLVKKQ